MIKILVIILVCFFLIQQNSISQVQDCQITTLDSNLVKRIYSNVNLESFVSDTLTFFKSESIFQIDIKNLNRLNLNSEVRSFNGLIIGAAIGLSIVAAFAILAGGNKGGHPNLSITTAGGIKMGILFGTIGAIVGAWIDGPDKKTSVFDFSKLTLNQKRLQLNKIIQLYF